MSTYQFICKNMHDFDVVLWTDSIDHNAIFEKMEQYIIDIMAAYINEHHKVISEPNDYFIDSIKELADSRVEDILAFYRSEFTITGDTLNTISIIESSQLQEEIEIAKKKIRFALKNGSLEDKALFKCNQSFCHSNKTTICKEDIKGYFNFLKNPDRTQINGQLSMFDDVLALDTKTIMRSRTR